MNKEIAILNETEIYSNSFIHYQDLIVRRTSNPEIFDVIKNRYGATGWYTLGQLKELCAKNGLWSEKLEGLHPVEPQSIALEDIATVFISEFANMNKDLFRYSHNYGSDRVFLKMSYARRRKIVSKVLDKIMENYKND